MIKTKEELRYYMECDKKALGIDCNYPKLIGDNVQMTVDSKILGGIAVCDNIVIGAGAVVVKNIDIPNSSWGGCILVCCQ